MLRWDKQLEALPDPRIGWDAQAQQRAAWAERKRRWDAIRAHEAQARVHRQLAEQHAEEANRYLNLTEVEHD